MTNKLTPLEPPFDPRVEAILANYPTQNGYLLALFRTFANSERFLSTCVPNLLGDDSPLDLRTREIVILRVTSNHDCEYEWGVHVAAFSKAAALTAKQVQSTHTYSPSCWSASEQTLIAIVDQISANSTLDDELLEKFQANWTVEQQLEIIALCGTYSTISYVANIARLAPEPFGAKFPAT